jgi:hypothetical protein
MSEELARCINPNVEEYSVVQYVLRSLYRVLETKLLKQKENI